MGRRKWVQGWAGSPCDFWGLREQQAGSLQGKEMTMLARVSGFLPVKWKWDIVRSPDSGFRKSLTLGHPPLPPRAPAPISSTLTAFILAQPSYDKRRMPRRVHSGGLSMYPYTFSVSAQCSMTTRWDGRGYPNSCCLSWKFQALSTICLYVHRCIEEPSISLKPTAASPPGCFLPGEEQWELVLHFVSHRMADLIKSPTLIMLGRGVEFQW